uniref:protein-tyrosine-phosphatase n=1 Tax=Crassostrea virginica TaxID=6565 RepID=A0A8B8BZV3_CRAVI|nr:uncharacterized protein LOC111114378 [Crassostrea virginica]
MGANPQNPAWKAIQAVDGNENQDYNSNSCAITDVDNNPFNRSTGFSIYTYDTREFYPLHNPKHLVYHHNPLYGCPSPIQNVTINYVTQGLVFINERPQENTAICEGANLMYTGIELCEIKVMGCDKNRYSQGCANLCPTKCKKQQCDAFNGSCIYGCSDPNALTLDCLVCKNGMYIKDKTCVQCKGHCKGGLNCNKSTGRCDNECAPYWTGDFCNEHFCPPHYYGDFCNSPCGQCRENGMCDNVTGKCPHGCEQHWIGPRCDDDPTENAQGEYSNEAMSGDNGVYYNTADFTTDIKTEELLSVISEKNTKENNVFLVEYKKLPVGNLDICKAGKQQANVVKNRFKTTFPYDHSRVILKENWADNDNDYINANFIKNKCTQYWPEKDKVLDVGPCKIKFLEETMYAYHTKRKFTVQQTNSSKRTITQFHYTAWPDHDTPEELGLVQFHRAVTKQYQSGGLMLVHCSAGVGRTGTFIGLDSLLKKGRESGRINVFEFVKQMREDRMTMVQTADQYICLHKALLCGFQEKDTVIGENNIPTKISSLLQDTSPLNQKLLYKEFKYLQALKPSYDEEDREDGKKPENKDKNKDLKILPVSKYRPYLTSYIKGRTDYINAVCVPSFTEPSTFILTQYPLKDTEVDLWRLCMDHNVHALVVLGENSQEQRKELDVFHIPFGNDNAILKGVELLLDKQKHHSSHTAVVLSKDGAEEVGVFCVLHNVLQQLRMDKEVDIFTAVRQIQTRRPEVISKLVVILPVCTPHYYGSDCNNTCGQCEGDDVCDNVTGHCPRGCKVHWNGTRCDDSPIDRSTEDQSNETHIGNDEPYYNIAEVTTFIRTEELQRVISERDTKENNEFLDEYKRAYIAAQGPKNVTLADFWRMIWQENVKFIVMLTNIIENGKFSKRTITQFHYTAWPDHGTPEELELVQFHKAVTKKYQSGGLMLVHCSAGVGRTGTFIGLDSLLKQGQKSGRINVFEFVRQMREDRMTMLQTAGVSWIPQKGSSICCTPFCLTTGNTGSSISGVSQDSLVISQEEQRKELDVFHIPFGNDDAILKGVELLLDKQKQNRSHTAVVLSKDGAEEVGVFCVLHNVLQQLRIDKEVDIFTAVRQIQTRRPEVISKLEEYRRCYELVPLSISEDGIYANM